jgi:1,4-alpha-glucan branching enzyme
MYAFSENYVLPISHDEVVHGKKSLINKCFGEYEDKFKEVRIALLLMMTYPGKKHLFMGSEFGQFSEWNYSTGLDFSLLNNERHLAMQRFFADINAYYKSTPALYTNEVNWDGFRWLVANDNTGNIIAYTRTSIDKAQTVLVVINFSGVQRYDYKIGVEGNKYRLAFLSNDVKYGGYEQSGDWVFSANNEQCGSFDKCIKVNLAPLSFMYLEEIK